MRKILLLVVWLCAIVGAEAQVSVTLRMDTSEILIGEQILLKLKVSAGSNDIIVVPTFPDSVLVDGVEVLDHYRESTAMLDAGRRQTIVEAYRITSFDSALYYIPPMEVQVGDSVYKSRNSMALKVISPDVDTTNVDKFYGPKENAEVYYDWNDLKFPFFLWMGGLLLLLLAVYIGISIKNNHRILPKIKLHFDGPPHKWAMRQINKLRQNRPDNTEDAHLYYANLTDIVRTYISRRYGFKATAMTSAQIVEQLQTMNDATLLAELKEMFEAADLVKYAGLNATIDEEDRNIIAAMRYVDATKESDVDKKRHSVPKEAAKVRRSRRERLLLVAGNLIIALAGLGLIVWAAVIMYDLYY